MKKEVAILMVISLIVGFLIGYGYMSIRINKMETTIKELEESLLDDALNRVLLEKCLDNAHETYRSSWDSSCEKSGLKKGCSLPSDVAERWDRYHTELRDGCFRRYPQD